MKVEPFTNLKDIRNVKRLLRTKPRDLLLWVMGINSGLRVQDLLSLRIEDLKDKKVGDRIAVREKKTNKENVIVINKEIASCFKFYMDKFEPDDNHFLFRSRKGINYPITTYRVTGLVKEWASSLNIQGNYGAHSLRKTFCYVQRVHYGTPWEVLCQRLRHSSPSITRRYLGIQNEEVEEILLNTI
ncbi:tyrosine-type recombinase/integrase [Maridesulfovibrio bastinii]|uniref:tyrosine-type recombinase/integrase n=1 Tax=Maridesulfovibrio bastinii TaxID=47157 RepID=UPI00041C635A|nr:tyrosine-type recombinase/integrase [Maridesulfovibrio bastinii]